MKKTLLLLSLPFMAMGISQAQNFGDFEDGTTQSWGPLYGEDFGIVANAENPSKVINTSDKVLQYTSVKTDGWKGITTAKNDGVFAGSSTEFSFDVYPMVAGQLGLEFENSISGAGKYESYINVTAGSWQHIVVDLTALAVKDYKNINIKYSPNDIAYFDNIKAIDGTTVNVNDVVASNVSIYPNPASSVLNIQSNNALAQVTVINMAGQTVLSTTVNSVNVSRLPVGQYVIVVKDVQGQVSNLKFIKK